jgi:hypothetical protein
MPIDPRKLADIMQRMQLARQAGAAGGLPPSGEYNGGGDIVTQDAPMQQMPQQMPQPMQGQGQMSEADMMRLQQMRAMQNRMPPR